MDLPEGVHLVTEEEFHKLMNEDRSSKYRLMELNNHRKPLGLEFDIHPELCELAGIYPLPGYRSTPENYHWIVGMATAAANEYFGPDGIERPVTAIMDVYGCEYPDLRSSYYITFIVDNNGMEEFFQAEVGVSSNNMLSVEYITHSRGSGYICCKRLFAGGIKNKLKQTSDKLLVDLICMM